MKIEFFLPMIPPEVTAQEHKITVKNGKPVFYDPPELKTVRAYLTGRLSQAKRIYGPDDPIAKTPIRLTTKWIWPGEKGAPESWKITKPDTDNLIKLFKDCMTKTGFWRDDALVCSEITEKFFGPVAGIFVRIETL